MSDLAALMKSALVLDVQDRAALAEKLLASLEEAPQDPLSQEETERLWVEEAQSRLAEYRAGTAGTVNASDLMGKAEKLLR
jgi:hypothetical protein